MSTADASDATADDTADASADGDTADVAVTAVVLCGGGATRFGADKLTQRLGSTTVLGHLLDALPASWSVVGVGAAREVARDVRWVIEEPADGGPLAGIAAGVREVSTELLVVIGGDMPFVAPWARRLAARVAADPAVGGASARGGDGRDTPLLAAYRTDVVLAALPGVTRNGRARLLLEVVPHASVDVPDDDLLDVDTPAALEVARVRLPQ